MRKILIALTSAVVIAGEIRKAGQEVEVDEALAKDLLHRGRGTLVEADLNEEQDEEVDLATLTKAQLIEFAQHEYELELDASLTKEKLIEAIQAAAETE
ncbi:hypothetical protein N5J48_12345 [Acinetobacter ursingii]|uniref:hypothetical protein n=1 Tax=Acinetobacter ursingii TaxID=108980 RepID=UPI0024488587|nr:hypothetical protein [Acinetobacter ursingii]MDH0008385.1 hypothetical protein [Acinetobacter ursingii]MDH0480163.1 hypothetical protein [Acinetobacter ursingii]MDH2120771.1 hypothetical protein [Acinetobacter ursingii]MDH2128341.1 hypothetical protein [Acinetobacter ursingii]